MEVAIRGRGPTAPFLSARDRFATEYDIDRFRQLFRSLGEDRSYRPALTDAVREYAAATAG
jgi:hypothetical protein